MNASLNSNYSNSSENIELTFNKPAKLKQSFSQIILHTDFCIFYILNKSFMIIMHANKRKLKFASIRKYYSNNTFYIIKK